MQCRKSPSLCVRQSILAQHVVVSSLHTSWWGWFLSASWETASVCVQHAHMNVAVLESTHVATSFTERLTCQDLTWGSRFLWQMEWSIQIYPTHILQVLSNHAVNHSDNKKVQWSSNLTSWCCLQFSFNTVNIFDLHFLRRCRETNATKNRNSVKQPTVFF